LLRKNPSSLQKHKRKAVNMPIEMVPSFLRVFPREVVIAAQKSQFTSETQKKSCEYADRRDALFS
jgi:hypothetical protein